MTTSKWKKTYQYQRLMQILEDYWLSEPDEAYVCVDMEFMKSDGQYQAKYVQWFNPNMDGKEIAARVKQKHKEQQEALEQAKREGLFKEEN